MAQVRTDFFWTTPSSPGTRSQPVRAGDLVRVIERSSSSLLGKIGIVIGHDVGPWRWWIFIDGQRLSVDRRIVEVIVDPS
jgi:hypothetical protein